jgi:unsaturated rhamnogalacturonyl hydrolase
MKRYLSLAFGLIFTLSSLLVGKANCKPIVSEEKLYILLADSEMKRNPKSWMLDFSAKARWEYCHGLELKAFLEVWSKTGNKKYFDYAKSYADTMINADGNIMTYDLSIYNIDRINPGKILFPLYKATSTEKYLKAIEILRSQMDSHPRISDGGFWHKKVYPNQMWLDGIYMGSPFLAEYGYRFNKTQYIEEAIHQILMAAKNCFDPKTGLYFHGYDESRQQTWANKETGHSPNFWSRGIGWYMMAMVDVLDFIPANHPKRPEIMMILSNLSQSLENYRDPKSGMWYQVTDKGKEEGNYLESSGSIMYIYTWVKGAQKGYLPIEYLKKGEEAYHQFLKAFLKNNNDGSVSITGACKGAGLGGSPVYRDGSYKYYISEPQRDNDPKVVGPLMMVSVLLDK